MFAGVDGDRVLHERRARDAPRGALCQRGKPGQPAAQGHRGEARLPAERPLLPGEPLLVSTHAT